MQSYQDLSLLGLNLSKHFISTQTSIVSFIERDTLLIDDTLKFKDRHEQLLQIAEGHSFCNIGPTTLFGPSTLEAPS